MRFLVIPAMLINTLHSEMKPLLRRTVAREGGGDIVPAYLLVHLMEMRRICTPVGMKLNNVKG